MNKAAQALGKKGGSVKSEVKAQSARENGTKGGRPLKNTYAVVRFDSGCGLETIGYFTSKKDALEAAKDDIRLNKTSVRIDKLIEGENIGTDKERATWETVNTFLG